MPEPSAPPQPRKPRRFWLWAPYAALLVAAVAWSGVWWLEKTRLEQAVTEQAARLREQGFAAGWTSLTVDGWPFRLHVVLAAPRLAEPSGWGLAASRIEAEALAYAPDRWILTAPDGLALTRPAKGALAVSGRAIRASASGLGSERPRLSFEGLDLTLAPGAGGQPAPISKAARLELHLQPGPEDQAALLLRIEGADLRPETPLARLSGGKPFALLWDSRLSHGSALAGPNWPAALQAWARAGGSMNVVQAKLGLGGLLLEGVGGPLAVDADGRLKGELPLKLTPGEPGQRQLLEGLGLLGPVALRFQDGEAQLGPIPIGRALKIG